MGQSPIPIPLDLDYPKFSLYEQFCSVPTNLDNLVALYNVSSDSAKFSFSNNILIDQLINSEPQEIIDRD